MAANRGYFGAPPPPRGGSAVASRRVDNRENLLALLVTQHRSLLLPSSIGLMDINNIIGLGEINSFTFLHFTNNKNDAKKSSVWPPAKLGLQACLSDLCFYCRFQSLVPNLQALVEWLKVPKSDSFKYFGLFNLFVLHLLMFINFIIVQRQRSLFSSSMTRRTRSNAVSSSRS